MNYPKTIILAKGHQLLSEETSLLRRLQAQTLPDEAPTVGKIYLLSKTSVTFEPIQRF